MRLEVKFITKKYGDNIAVDNISFSGSIPEILNDDLPKTEIGFKNQAIKIEQSSILGINYTLQPFVFSNIETNSFKEIDSIVSQDFLYLLIETGKTLRLYSELINDKINNKN